MVATRSLWPLLTLLSAAMPQAAQAKDGGGGAAADSEDTDFDDDEVLDTGKPGKRPSHFAIKTSARFGLRHAFDQDFSLEAFVRDQQGALDNPLALRSSVIRR